MAKKSPEYWQKRFEQVLIDSEKLSVNYEKEMAKIYAEVVENTQKQLESFYQRYSNETGLDLAEVKKRLDPSSLKRFKDQQKIYLREVEKLVKKGVPLKQYSQQLKELSARAYVTKLQEIQYNLNSEINILTGKQQTNLQAHMKDTYLQGYFKSVFELQKGMGFGVSFTVPNNEDVQKVLSTPWSGTNYADAIWKNKAKLTQWLNTDLPRHFASGASVQRMASDLRKKLDTDQKSAIRLVRTETNYISNQSTMDAYKNYGITKYQILATLDARTSETCRDMDGRIFDVKDKKVGINMPPFHPYCRTTTVAYFEDEDLSDMERVARDEDGHKYKVPASMDYSQWNLKYGQGAPVKKGKTAPEKPVLVQQATTQVEGTTIPKEEPNYKDFTQEKVDDWSHDVVPELTDEQKSVLYEYTGVHYGPINSHLRKGYTYPDPDILKEIDIIRSAMKQMPEDTRLFRVMNKYDFLKTFGDDFLTSLQPTNDVSTWKNKLVGKAFTDKGFQSTSWTPKSKYIESRLDDRSILFRIKTPKGTKAIPVEKFSLVPDEKEIILNAGNRYIVTGIKQTDTPQGVLIIVDCLLHEGL